MTNTSVFSRISHWFKPSGQESGTLPLEDERATLSDSDADRAQTIPVTTFLKPWAKRDAALSQLQEGFNSLTNLMSSVKENLDRQSQRQDELLRILHHLPEALRA